MTLTTTAHARGANVVYEMSVHPVRGAAKIAETKEGNEERRRGAPGVLMGFLGFLARFSVITQPKGRGNLPLVALACSRRRWSKEFFDGIGSLTHWRKRV